MEVLNFAKAYASLGTAIHEQIDLYLYVGPIHDSEPSITSGAMSLIRERLINPFMDSPNEEVADLAQILDEADGDTI